MKSRTKNVAPNANAPERIAYILPQGNLKQKSRRSGRSVRGQKRNDPSGYVLVGMYESLGKTFTSHEAAAKYAKENGFKLRTNRRLHNPRVPVPAVAAALASEA